MKSTLSNKSYILDTQSYSKNSNFYDFSHNFGNYLFLHHGSGKQEDCSALLQGKLPSKVFLRFQIFVSFCITSVKLLSCVRLCDLMDCSTPGFPVHHQLQEFTQTHVIELVMPSNHLILCCPLLLPPSVFPSIRVFSNESVIHIRWPKYWSFSFIVSPSNEYSGLISFRMDWLDLLAVQETLKSLLQHHSSKASIIQCSAFLWSNSYVHT